MYWEEEVDAAGREVERLGLEHQSLSTMVEGVASARREEEHQVTLVEEVTSSMREKEHEVEASSMIIMSQSRMVNTTVPAAVPVANAEPAAESSRVGGETYIYCTICSKKLNVKSFKRHMRNIHETKRSDEAPSSPPPSKRLRLRGN